MRKTNTKLHTAVKPDTAFSLVSTAEHKMRTGRAGASRTWCRRCPGDRRAWPSKPVGRLVHARTHGQARPPRQGQTRPLEHTSHKGGHAVASTGVETLWVWILSMVPARLTGLPAETRPDRAADLTPRADLPAGRRLCVRGKKDEPARFPLALGGSRKPGSCAICS